MHTAYVRKPSIYKQKYAEQKYAEGFFRGEELGWIYRKLVSSMNFMIRTSTSFISRRVGRNHINIINMDAFSMLDKKFEY